MVKDENEVDYTTLLILFTDTFTFYRSHFVKCHSSYESHDALSNEL